MILLVILVNQLIRSHDSLVILVNQLIRLVLL